MPTPAAGLPVTRADAGAPQAPAPRRPSPAPRPRPADGYRPSPRPRDAATRDGLGLRSSLEEEAS
ncbi:hypothetical protein HF526_34230 [Pseudonocardia sp. K10HN5]|uniref:Uncharacterized protein n=1 Tax=Pseudonocardia acidicola TaxID=2724939 RepID=A0ABX1SN78_9PSEU|nr:hypothetical protein [Pseudonocardia acidicola]